MICASCGGDVPRTAVTTPTSPPPTPQRRDPPTAMEAIRVLTEFGALNPHLVERSLNEWAAFWGCEAKGWGMTVSDRMLPQAQRKMYKQASEWSRRYHWEEVAVRTRPIPAAVQGLNDAGEPMTWILVALWWRCPTPAVSGGIAPREI